ncbi:hypothetical protein A9Q98_02485 [Thalassotalea sp. 42_200_T64]|nr:hypothetical protein A9Q98_02485 [Thalassotalea sp. 42_200_T64]
MKVTKTVKLNTTLSLLFIAMSQSAYAAENNAKASIDFNLRYENVSQDNAKKDADALTLRTKLNYQTQTVNLFSAFVEFEDSRTVGIEDYNDTNGKNADYSVIADPESTEVDQAYVQYKSEQFSTKLGRQVITLDGHRFVGHVGWRQDKQTFDALSFAFKPGKDLSLNYAYISKRNRIFAEAKDIDAKDHLLNASYTTGIGKFTAYGYFLEVDNNTDNALDTFGLSYSGNTKISDNKLIYRAEFATQTAESAGNEFDASYLSFEAGMAFSGVTAKLGFESLGSDGGNYGFSTPLATLHKFNGWSDQFLTTPAQGLDDIYVAISGKAFGGRWSVVYHDFSANEASDTIDDLGSEINALYSKGFAKHYSAGLKFAAYSAGDAAAGKVDTDKVWLWVGAKF